MKRIMKVSFLFFMLFHLLSCATPNEPASVEGILNIEHLFEVSGYAMDISVTDSHLYIAEDQAGYTIYNLNSNDMISHHESFIQVIMKNLIISHSYLYATKFIINLHKKR